MPLVSTVLSAELQALPDLDDMTSPQAAMNVAGAFHTYFLGSQAMGLPFNAGIGAAAETAMIGAMAGITTVSAAATSIQAGCVAYWGALNVPGAWGTSIPPTVPPPGLAGLGAAIDGVFAANSSGRVGEAGYDAIAAAWHGIIVAGGLATFLIPPVPPPVPVPTPFPVL